MFLATYTLSNWQRKDLYVRGYDLWIALPDPGLDDLGPAEIVVRTLPELSNEPLAHIAEARRTTLPVDPTTGGEGVTGFLGAILTDDEARQLWHVRIAVIVARIRTRFSRPHGRMYRWPLSVTVGPRQASSKIAKMPSGGRS